MKLIRIMAIGAIVTAMLAAGTMAMAQNAKGRLLFTIKGFPQASGYAMVALFDSEAAFKGDEGQACYSKRIKLTRTQVRLAFEDLASGWYAISTFHDSNSNNVLGKHKMGIKGFAGEPADADETYRRILNGDFARVGLGLTLYDNLFEGYSTPGTNAITIMCLCGFEPWRKYAADYAAGRKTDYNRTKQQMTVTLIKRIEERLIPGLSSMIEVKESATPLTNWRYTGNPGGAIYGFARPGDQLSPLPVRTPVTGLYLASAWTHGGGYTPAMMAGRQAAETLVKDWQKGL